MFGLEIPPTDKPKIKLTDQNKTVKDLKVSVC